MALAQAGSYPLLSPMPQQLASQRRARPGRGRRLLRALWAALERGLGSTSTCDRCSRPMLDFCERGKECICIACVAAEAEARSTPIASAELAGCAAALQELLREVRHIALDRSTSEPDRIDALVQTASGLVWWMTPPNLRSPNRLTVDKDAVIHLLARYEAKWGRATGTRTFAATFQFWMQLQFRALQTAALADVDRRYCALTGRESVMRDVTHPARPASAA